MGLKSLLPAISALTLATWHQAATAASDAESINALGQAYEHELAKAYAPVQSRLQGWLDGQRAQEINNLTAAMNANSGDARLFVAFHLLVMDPHSQAARNAFIEAKIDPPLAEDGTPTGTFALSAAVDTTLAQQVSSNEHPPMSAVAAAIDLHSDLVNSYWETQRTGLAKLRTDLLAFQDPNEQSQVYQLLAYYYPSERKVVQWFHAQGRAVPSDRWWVDDVDQFLITHELVAHDLLRRKPKFGAQPRQTAPGTWTVPSATWIYASVRSVRLEGVVVASGGPLPPLFLCDDKGGGVELDQAGTKEFTLVMQPGHKLLGHGTTLADLSKPTPLELEVRDKHVQVSVGGLPLIKADLSHAFAFHRFTIAGHALIATSLNLRFISSQGPQVTIGVATWPEERKDELNKTLTLSLNDTSVDEAIAVISRLSGVTITLDDSGELLKDLPVSLEAKDMRLESVLQSIERETDLHATPTAAGIVLSWKK